MPHTTLAAGLLLLLVLIALGWLAYQRVKTKRVADRLASASSGHPVQQKKAANSTLFFDESPPELSAVRDEESSDQGPCFDAAQPDLLAPDVVAAAEPASHESEPFYDEWNDKLYDGLMVFGDVKQEINLNAKPKTLSDKLQFTVFTPQAITPGSSFVLDVWACLNQDLFAVNQIAKSLSRDKMIGHKSGVLAYRGSLFTLSLQIDGLEIAEPTDTLVWDGEPANASFLVQVPEDIMDSKLIQVGRGKTPTSLSGKVLIGVEGFTVAKLVFIVFVSPDANEEYAPNLKVEQYPETAFASYASEDREEVLHRIQGMKKVAPGLDVFLDVMSLRSGDQWLQKIENHVDTRDIFYLFWSQAASNSEWVDHEWRLALKKRGIHYISPVPLVEPQIAQPPTELSSLHFNDAYMAYAAAEKLKNQQHPVR